MRPPWGTLPIDARLAVLVALYPVVGAAFTPVTELFLVATALLFGINTAMLAYHLRDHGVELREDSGSVAGIVFGHRRRVCGLWICPAGVLSLFGMTGILTQLPLDGLEFSVLAFGILSLSVYWLADGMRGEEIDRYPVDIRS